MKISDQNLNVKKSPGISVIIPTHNRAHLIEKAIKSVLNQTYKNYEILIIDDGSTDNTEKILKKFKEIKYFKKKNEGVSSARNLGIKKSKGEFIAFLDSDDFWPEKKLEKTIEKFCDERVVLVYTDYFLIDQEDNVLREIKAPFYGKKAHKKILLGNFVPNSSVIIRKEVLKKTGLFFEGFKCKAAYEDWDLWVRMAKIGKITKVEEHLLFYKKHDSNALTDNSYDAVKTDLFLVTQRIFERNKSLSWLMKRRILANALKLLGAKCFYNNRPDLSRINYSKALILYPFDFEAVSFLMKSCFPKFFLFFLRKLKNDFNRSQTIKN